MSRSDKTSVFRELSRAAIDMASSVSKSSRIAIGNQIAALPSNIEVSNNERTDTSGRRSIATPRRRNAASPTPPGGAPPIRSFPRLLVCCGGARTIIPSHLTRRLASALS